MESNDQATFAELGMESAMSTLIDDKLNRELDLHLPLNTYHTHVDLVSLTMPFCPISVWTVLQQTYGAPGSLTAGLQM